MDIRFFFGKENVSPKGSRSTESTQTGGATDSQMTAANEVKVKKDQEEEDVDLEGGHSHQFTVKFPNDKVEYSIDCDQSCTVLEAIKSHLNEQFTMMTQKKTNYSDENIIIQLGIKGKESVVATHFPCSCIQNHECLTIYCKTEKVEETKSQHGRVLPRDKYSAFYISKDGGEKAKRIKLFRSNTVREFDYLCVYAKKGMTVREALERDGRFIDLQDFKLSKDMISKKQIVCTETVDKLDQKMFKICHPKLKTAKAVIAKEQATRDQQGQQEQPSTSKQSQQKVDTKAVLVKAQQSGISLKRAMEETGSTVNTKEIYKLLCEQYPHLKELMESRFPGSSYQKTLELKKKNFGKIQQSFSEVDRLMKLLKLGQSVCLLKIKISFAEVQGTGFVLYGNFIITNAHLFKKCTDLPEDKWKDYAQITAEFTYENPDGESTKKQFKAKLSGSVDALDYAILELESQSSNQTAETQEAEVPPGLLGRFGPPPEDGEACLIGHPEGGGKKIDPTCIIAKGEREQAVDQNLQDYRENIMTLCAINQEIKKDPYADVHVTYNTFMYRGSSGSPVFDAHGQVFGLHTGGFFFDSVKPKESVLEYALPLLEIFKDFVRRLKDCGHQEQFDRVQATVQGNPYLTLIIEEVIALEPMDTN